MRWLLAFLCLSFAVVSQASSVETLDGKIVEKVLVLKSARQLQLINDGKPIKTYRISLGRNPKGQKLMEGDRRTPKACTGWTGAKSATASTWPCTSPTRTSATLHARAAKAWPQAA